MMYLSLFLLIITTNTVLSYKSGSYQSGSYQPQQQNKNHHHHQNSWSNQQSWNNNYKPSKQHYKELVNVYEAKNLEFAFPTENERRATLQNGNYDPDSPIPIDVDVYFPPRGGDAKIFLTIPRFGKGVPYSLAYLTNVKKPNGSEIQPYPSYNWHKTHGLDCDGLTSVYRVQIDSCGQMWILDSGEIEFVQHCAPQIVVIDLATDQLVHRYRLPKAMYKEKISRFVTPLVDFADPGPHGDCKEAFVYMADPTGVGIVVYDVIHNQSWRIENKYTYPDPDFGTHTVAGESFELLDGSLGLAVTPRGHDLQRFLYFHSLSNDMEVAVPLDVINNSTLWAKGISSALNEFIPLGKRDIQCAASAMTEQGFLLCGFLDPIGIFGWNIRSPYTYSNRVLLAENPTTLQFVSGIKVIKNQAGKEEVWMLSNRLQKAFTGTIDFKELNYRIQRCGVDELLLAKSCRP